MKRESSARIYRGRGRPRLQSSGVGEVGLGMAASAFWGVKAPGGVHRVRSGARTAEAEARGVDSSLRDELLVF